MNKEATNAPAGEIAAVAMSGVADSENPMLFQGIKPLKWWGAACHL